MLVKKNMNFFEKQNVQSDFIAINVQKLKLSLNFV